MTFYDDSRPLALLDDAFGIFVSESAQVPADTSFTKVWDWVLNNKLTTGVAISIGFVALYFLKDLRRHDTVVQENQVLRKENDDLKVKVKEFEITVGSMSTKMETLETKLEAVGQLCVICQDQALNSTFVPCGHAVCGGCAMKLKRCPFCNNHVEQVIARY